MLRNGKAFPQVLEVGKTPSTPASNDSSVKASMKLAAKNAAPAAVPASAKLTPSGSQKTPQAAPQQSGQATGQTTGTQAGQQTAQSANKPSTPPVFDGRRIVGMQYVWVQSYPDPEDANDAVEVLKKPASTRRLRRTCGSRRVGRPSSAPVLSITRETIQTIRHISNPSRKSARISLAPPSSSFDPRPIGWKDQSQ